MEVKKVLITGAARGIGYELVEKFVSAGNTVIMVDKDRLALESAYKEISQKYRGARIFRYRCDVENIKDIKDIRDGVGNIDVLINNAGIGFNGEMADMCESDWQKLININLLGPINMINYFLPVLKERKGIVVNVSSGQAFFRLPGWGGYMTSKIALGAMSELLSFELSKYDINVVTVYPFMVDTPFYNGMVGDTLVSKLAMRLVPFYSNSPKTVAEKIYQAVQKRKRIEMVNPINRVGQLFRIPGISNVFTYIMNLLLTKR